jgi:low molecular weight protein-tyrosine phosphatase
MRILFVCLGNICRSPSAEAVMRKLLEQEGASVEQEGASEAIELDSAGTSAWHCGEPPDARAAQAARRRGLRLSGAARQVLPEDFERFDLILAMDRSNLRALQQLAPDDEARAKLRMLRELDPSSAAVGDLDVPDPYHGGPEGFDEVLDLLEAACAGLLVQVRSALRT